MALRGLYKSEAYADTTGYYRINEVHSQYEKNHGESGSEVAIQFQVEAFKDGSDELLSNDCNREANECICHVLSGCTNESVGNLVDKAYAYLKTLPHFSEAEDC